MKDMRDLIAAKQKQMAVLQKHIDMLEQMAAEEAEVGGAAGMPRRGRRGRPGRKRGGQQSRADLVEAYLKNHRGARPAKEIAAALGLKPAELHSAVNPGLKTGRFARGEARATYVLASAVSNPKRRRRRRAARRAQKRKTSLKAQKPEATKEAGA